MASSSLDLKNAARSVWLVKVPKYLSQKWQQEAGSNEIGRLKITRPITAKGKPDVVFTTAEPPTNRTSGSSSDASMKEHKFIIGNVDYQTLAILRETRSSEPGSSQSSLEGKVVQRAECRPVANDAYMAMKKVQFVESAKPERMTQGLGKAEVKYKPVARHVDHVDQEKARKEGKDKSIRLDKHDVQEIIFRAFQKHQYYNIRDLARITQQPYTYLREILTEVCQYNTCAPHKSMWELKPEYRHYKDDA